VRALRFLSVTEYYFCDDACPLDASGNPDLIALRERCEVECMELEVTNQGCVTNFPTSP
jgi:hypothetical protein